MQTIVVIGSLRVNDYSDIDCIDLHVWSFAVLIPTKIFFSQPALHKEIQHAKDVYCMYAYSDSLQHSFNFSIHSFRQFARYQKSC